MQTIPPILVFCDLDDTLFEPHSVDASTHRALDRIEREHLPLVFCSTKTRAELELIQHDLGINQPFICENGAATFIPRGYFGPPVSQAIDVAGYEVIEFGKPYTDVVGALRRAADRLDTRVIGFNDMSVEDVATDCDLPLLQARLAKLREYSEPFRIVDARPGTDRRLLKTLRTAGVECTNRGRYYHAGASRRDAGCEFLRGLYRRAFGEVVTVAFCDHRSGVAILRHADIPLIVPSSTTGETTHLLAKVPSAGLSVATTIGAWADIVLGIADAVQRRGNSCSS